ncbi:MAG TPA: hypothetical protein VJ875_04710 [Pyrinomonadaceae bacterium]|nr:hypothetical protein [Pyrinomonadaceae bacterium]
MVNARNKLFLEIEREPKRRPYGAYVDFFLNDDDIQFSFDGPAAVFASDDAIVQFDLTPDQPLGPLQHLKSYRASIEGFTTASEAESMGVKLSLALLWSAVTQDFGVRLDYHSALPCTVYDRTEWQWGPSTRGHLSNHYPATAGDLGELMRDVLTSTIEADRQLVLSMELYAAARLEVSDRAKFLGLVSSLEPLAEQALLPLGVRGLIKTFRDQLGAIEINELPSEDAAKLKTSLNGRLKHLERESIRQALLRVIRECFPGDGDSAKVIDAAYGLRSDMLHKGTTDPYLDRRTHAIEQIIRRLYAARIGKPLRIGS